MMTVSSLLSLLLVGSALVQALPSAPISTVTVTKTVDRECPTPSTCPVCPTTGSNAPTGPQGTPSVAGLSTGGNTLSPSDNPDNTASNTKSVAPSNTPGGSPSPTTTLSASSSTTRGGTSSPTPSPETDPDKKCNGMKNAKYVSRKSAEKVIRDKFCPEVSKKTSPDEGTRAISKVFFKDKNDEFQVSIEWQSPEDFKKISNEECVEGLVGKLLNTCDLPGKINNPNNWTGGGKRKEGKATYFVTPLAQSYPSGTMRIDVHEEVNDDKTGISSNIGLFTVGHDKRLWYGFDKDVKWGDTKNAVASASHFPWTLDTTFARDLQRRADEDNADYQKYSLLFHYGGTKWDSTVTDKSKFPHCETEGWKEGENGGNPTRDVSCYYKYPENSPF